ncbi:hypothetical protein KIPB_010547 [Kipferlia bialata]|uniref:Uncharacterized protein n=1 Tax=Kipferlia bialata TaxID=797122 RepID=A0A391NPM0_9EUKA|nr:hypothetical protein KIPB_010547 [Kipferlia bialata]|eukprot:g10547.t1
MSQQRHSADDVHVDVGGSDMEHVPEIPSKKRGTGCCCKCMCISAAVLVLSCVCLVVAALALGSHTPITVYVDPSGSDTNPGTETNPIASLSLLSSVALGLGDTVLFHRGRDICIYTC